MLLLTIINKETGEVTQFYPELSLIVDLDNNNREYIIIPKDEK